MGALPVTKLTPEEYFAMDDVAEGRLEYHDGEVFPVVAATPQHALILVSTSSCLAIRLKGGPCVAGAQFRVRTTARNYVVPDIAIVCGGLIMATDAKDAVTNPKVIVEILSPSTDDFDHGGKFALYRELESFTDYILIAQDKPKVEVFHKEAPNQWLLSIHDGLDADIRIESLGIEIPAHEIYAGIEFAATDPA